MVFCCQIHSGLIKIYNKINPVEDFCSNILIIKFSKTHMLLQNTLHRVNLFTNYLLRSVKTAFVGIPSVIITLSIFISNGSAAVELFHPSLGHNNI
jgi:hypothetical protein